VRGQSSAVRRVLGVVPGWAMVGLKNVVARGMGIEAVATPCLVLLDMAIVFFAIGLSRLRLE
jgi:hypothetical protein